MPSIEKRSGRIPTELQPDQLRERVLRATEQFCTAIQQGNFALIIKACQQPQLARVLRQLKLTVTVSRADAWPMQKTMTADKSIKFSINDQLLADNEGAQEQTALIILEQVLICLQNLPGAARLSPRSAQFADKVDPSFDIAAYFIDRGIPRTESFDHLSSVNIYDASLYHGQQTLTNLQSAYPGIEFRRLASKGSSAHIYYDPMKPNEVYKVMKESAAADKRGSHRYDYFSNEVEMIHWLAAHNLGPKLLAVAGPKDFKYAERNCSVPILQMERIDFDDDAAYRLPLEEKRAWVDRIVPLLVADHLVLGDVEIVLDKTVGDLRVIDAGGMTYQPKAKASDIRRYTWEALWHRQN